MALGEINVVFFDLFYTLVTPRYHEHWNENDVLQISREEWEVHSEDLELYVKRATGLEKEPLKIIESILRKMGIEADDSDVNEILALREERFKHSLVEVDLDILRVLEQLKRKGKRLCLISNADPIDVKHWRESPLANLFDQTIFSYEVGYVKPQSEIYQIALCEMKAHPEECIFIGDGGSQELQGAKEAGISTVLTSYLLKRDEEQMEELKEYADFYTEDFREIDKICV